MYSAWSPCPSSALLCAAILLRRFRSGMRLAVPYLDISLKELCTGVRTRVHLERVVVEACCSAAHSSPPTTRTLRERPLQRAVPIYAYP